MSGSGKLELPLPPVGRLPPGACVRRERVACLVLSGRSQLGASSGVTFQCWLRLIQSSGLLRCKYEVLLGHADWQSVWLRVNMGKLPGGCAAG
jgi:hypothetical protein